MKINPFKVTAATYAGAPRGLTPPADILDALLMENGGMYREHELDGCSLYFIGINYAALMADRLKEAMAEAAPAQHLEHYRKQVERGVALSKRIS